MIRKLLAILPNTVSRSKKQQPCLVIRFLIRSMTQIIL